MSRPRLAPFTGPAPRPAASDSAPETITLSDSTEPTGPMGGPPGAQPLAEFSVTPFPTSESTVSHDVTPASRPRSRLSLIIAVLAVLAVVVVGLAVFKFLQQRGLLGGGATLIVRINPADAEVSLDGQPLGSVSPNRITGVQPGPHALEARRDNYQPYQESLELRSGEQRELDIAMTFVPATLKLEFEPPDARVSMDGEPIGAKSPITKNDVVPGIKHSFVFEREGYESTTREWGLKAKEERTEKIALKEILFDLEVDSDPSGAKVLLDNALRGRTPTVIKGLKAYKSYQLVLQSDRGEQWNSTIQWDGAPVKKVRGRLEPAAAVSPPPDKPTPPPPKPDRPPTTRRHRPTPTKPLASGLLRLNATPWGKVVIDSKDEGLETPLLKHSLPVGKHKATINFADGRSKTVEFEIKADETTKVIVRPD